MEITDSLKSYSHDETRGALSVRATYGRFMTKKGSRYRDSIDHARGANVQQVRDPDQVGERPRPQLLHRSVTMHFDGHFADADLGGDLLVHPPQGDQGDDLSFTRAQGFET